MPSSDMVPEFDPQTKASLERTLFSVPALPSPILNPDGCPMNSLRFAVSSGAAQASGTAEGELVGGNLSLIAATMGTPWELDTEGKIIFLEDIDETPYRIDRMLNQLRLAGKFEACAGIVIGSWTRCEPQAGKPSLTIEEIIGDLILPCGKPILSGLEAGHGSPALTLPLGIRYRMDVGALSLEMLESPYAD
jgi:muramoyltetrapeptide carboxypeptidase